MIFLMDSTEPFLYLTTISTVLEQLVEPRHEELTS